jgi:hypothetical protein
LINFCPEAFFKGDLCGFQSRSLFDEVKVGEDSNDFGKTVSLKYIEKFECFLCHGSALRRCNENEIMHTPSRSRRIHRP